MRPFWPLLTPVSTAPFFASLTVRGLHFTVYAPSMGQCSSPVRLVFPVLVFQLSLSNRTALGQPPQPYSEPLRTVLGQRNSPYPVLPFLVFWKRARKTTRKTRIFYPYRSPKIPGKEEKNTHKNPRKSSQGKKQGNPKKQGKEGQGRRALRRLLFASWVLNWESTENWDFRRSEPYTKPYSDTSCPDPPIRAFSAKISEDPPKKNKDFPLCRTLENPWKRREKTQKKTRPQNS